MRAGLLHLACRDKLRDQHRQQPMIIQKLQPLHRPITRQDRVQLIVNTLGRYLRQQRRIAHHQPLRRAIHRQMIARHQPHGPEHAQRIMPKHLAINRPQPPRRNIGHPIQRINTMQPRPSSFPVLLQRSNLPQFNMPHNLIQRGCDRIHRKVPLPQIKLHRLALQRGNIKNNLLAHLALVHVSI